MKEKYCKLQTFLFYKKNNRWFDRFLKYTHVRVLEKDVDTGLLTLSSYLSDGIHVTAATVDMNVALKTMYQSEHVVFHLTVRRYGRNMKMIMPYSIITCANFVRLKSGLDIPFCLTPYRLYKKIKKYNGLRNFKITDNN